jgi:hypothetical protein
MGKDIDELRVPAELNHGTKHDLSDLYTASRLLNQEVISERFGQRWSDVVHKCVNCDLHQARMGLDDASFQKAVYNEIFAELEEEHRQFFGLS